MAEKLTVNLTGNIVPECIGDISILLIDHDAISVASLTPMLKKRSYKVISVNVASEAVSIIEKQKDIGLVIANIQMPHKESHSFLTAMLHKEIPLILIGPEINIKEASDLLTKRACFCLKKPISENDINNLWQHVVVPNKSQELESINIAEQQENIVDESMKQIEAFRNNIKRQRTSQLSLLGRRPFIKTFTASETYQKRKSLASDEWKTKAMSLIETENKKEEENKMESTAERRKSLWTRERHMKFLTAISILGEKDSRPKAILEIMNDSNLNHRQVGSHLQKYKFQVERIGNTLTRNEWKSTDKTFEYPSDYKYPFKASNLAKNFIESNSLWYSLREKKSSSSIVQYSFKKSAAERKSKMLKFHLGGKLDLSIHSFSGNILNKSSMKVTDVPSATSNNPSYNIPSTSDVNNSGLSSDNPHVLSGLPSNVGASNLDAFQKESAESYISQSNPNPPQSSSSVLETDRNPLDCGPIYLPDSNVPQDDLCTMNPLKTNIDIGSVSSAENYSHHETNMNQMDWVPEDINMIVPETNTNQMDRDWVFSEESYALLEDMNFAETNITQVGLVPHETSYAALDNVVPIENNRDEMGLVPSEEGNDIPIEDLISFDTDVNEMSLDSWLENYDFSQRDIPLSVSHNGQDLAFTPTDSVPHVSMEDHDHSLAMHLGSCGYQNTEATNPSEALEGGNRFDDDSDQNMDWIDDILDKNA